MYKILLFDLDHTLFDFDNAEKIALGEFFTDLKVDDVEKYYEKYKEINFNLWRMLEKGEISREELLNTRFSRVFEVFGIKVDGRELSNKYVSYIGKRGDVFEGAENLLNILSKDYDIYAASNGIWEIQKNRLSNSSITKYFKKIFISEKMGFVKPQIEYFQYIENEITDFSKNTALMIGDNLLADIKGASDFGIDTIWYNPLEKNNNLDVKPTFTVKNYSEIIKILKK